MSPFRATCLVFAFALSGAISPAFAANFTVTGSDTTAKTLAPGSGATETGTVTGTGDLNVSGSTNAVTITGGSGTRTAVIDNSGKIRQIGTGRAIRNSSGAAVTSITNHAGATISSVGDDTIQVSTAGSSFTLDNSGLISSGSNRAVNLRDIGGSNTINNLLGGILRATNADAVRPGVNGIINNFGLIEALPILETPSAGVTQATGSDGIQADITSGAPVTGVNVTNSGTISGRHGITGSAGASANFTISVTNDADSSIIGVNGSGINIDNNGSFLGNATVINDGSIIGNFNSTLYNTGDGDGVDVDGLVDITNNGIIRGLGAGGLGSDGGANNPEGVSVGGGTIVNNVDAEITGQDTTGPGTKGHGILVDNSSGGNAFAATTVTNAGLIRGFDSYAIRFIGSFADTITNNATGTIRGAGNSAEGAAIQTGDGGDTLTNRGAIIGDNGLAVDLEAGNDVMHIIGSSASITGDVSGGTGTNSLGIDGSFTYSGVLSNFATVEVKSGTVTLSGASTYTGSTTVTAGTLNATNSTGSATGTGTVTVKSGARLGGTGTVGAVSSESGSTIAPGASAGTLIINGNLGITDGSKFTFELGTVSDFLGVTGTLTFTGGGAAIVNIVDSGIVPGTDYTLVSFASSSGFTGANVTLGSMPSGLDATLEVTATDLILHTADSEPNAFSFTDLTNVAVNKLQNSNRIDVTGINVPAAISITGGEYQIGNTPWTNAAGVVSPNARVKLRHTSAGAPNTATNTILTIGGVSDTFTSTTAGADSAPNAFSFSDLTDVEFRKLIPSNVIKVLGTTVASTISITGGEYYSQSSGGWTSAPGTVNPNDWVKVRQTSASTPSTATNTVLTIGGVSDTFTTTTTATTDTTPDAFSFTDLTGVPQHKLIPSNIIRIRGTNAPSAISIINGEYLTQSNGAWTSAPGMVNPNDWVKVRQTSASAPSTATNTTLTIGGVSDTFMTTTAP